MPSRTEERAPRLGAARAVIAAWAAFGVANGFVVFGVLHWVPFAERCLIAAVQLGQMLALGLLQASGAAAVRAPRTRDRLFAVTIAALPWGAIAAVEDLSSFVARVFDGQRIVLALLAVVLAGSITVAAAVGMMADRPRWRWLAIAGAVVAVFLNYAILHGGYVFLHMHVLIAAGTLAANAGRGVSVRWRRTAAVTGLASLFALASLIVTGDARLVPLTMLRGAPPNLLLLRVRASLGGGSMTTPEAGDVADGEGAWFERRDEAEPVPPTVPGALREAPIVLMFTVDALRPDLIQRADLRERLPFFRELSRTSVSFERVWSSAPGTAESLTSLFASKYASQILWRRRTIHRPHLDPSPRFPQLLTEGQIHTLHINPMFPFNNAFGHIRGFLEVVDLETKSKEEGKTGMVPASVAISHMRERLDAQLLLKPRAPIFGYTHLLDPHEPYDDVIGSSGEGEFEDYLREVEHVGELLAELIGWVDAQGLKDRTTLIVTADHGEAFGEHGARYHHSSMYEEQLRVPLFVRIPGVAPRRISEHVTLLDVAPTVLDLFGVATPGSYMGQSLVPLILERATRLERPIAADNRVRRAWVTPEGIKVIRDMKIGTVEVYDLVADPDELHNLQGSAHQREVRRLDAFFRNHLHPAYDDHPPLGL